MTDNINTSLIQALYISLRNEKKEKYNEDNYFWRLGFYVIDKLEVNNSVYANRLLNPGKSIVPTLYGIRVEVDFVNPKTIRLFEDITYSIGEKAESEEEE